MNRQSVPRLETGSERLYVEASRSLRKSVRSTQRTKRGQALAGCNSTSTTVAFILDMITRVATVVEVPAVDDSIVAASVKVTR